MNEPRPNIYDPANAAVLCRASALAYEPTIQWNAALGCTCKIISDEATDTRAVIFMDATDWIVAFRGTAGMSNWITDLKCELMDVGSGLRVHRGFFEAALAISEEVFDGLCVDGSPRRLWVTGHSLGGAMAKLLAVWAAQRGYDLAGVYTFGQPRVGDGAFARYYDRSFRERTFRVVHADDIVPRLAWLLGSYRHCGHEVFYPFPNSSQPGYYTDLAWPAKLTHDIPSLIYELFHDRLSFLDEHHVSKYEGLYTKAA